MRERRRDMGVIGDRRGAGRERGAVDVEGAADAVEGVDDMRRPVEPADAQIGEAEDLREGAGHHDVVARRDELEARSIVIAPHILGISGIEDQQDMRAAGRRAIA